MKNPISRLRRAQTLVEYMLGVSVIAIAIAAGFILLTDSTAETFKNAREVVQRAYP